MLPVDALIISKQDAFAPVAVPKRAVKLVVMPDTLSPAVSTNVAKSVLVVLSANAVFTSVLV